MKLIDGVVELLAAVDALGLKKGIITKNTPRSVNVFIFFIF